MLGSWWDGEGGRRGGGMENVKVEELGGEMLVCVEVLYGLKERKRGVVIVRIWVDDGVVYVVGRDKMKGGKFVRDGSGGGEGKEEKRVGLCLVKLGWDNLEG